MFKNKMFLYGLGTGLIIGAIILQLAMFNDKQANIHTDEGTSSIEWNDIFIDQLEQIKSAAQHHGYDVLKHDQIENLSQDNSSGTQHLIDLQEQSSEIEPILLIIPVGMTSSEVGDLLMEHELIDDLEAYDLEMRARQLTSRIQAGSYRFEWIPKLTDLITLITK